MAAPTRREEAIALVREARQLAERKGLLVIVERAQGMLDELGT